ncbi:hypothetical protein [Rhodoflexus sp.]
MSLFVMMLTFGEWLPNGRHSPKVSFDLPTYLPVLLDSPPAEGGEELSEKAKRAQQRKEELSPDCICPQNLRDSIIFEQVEASFYANYYDTLQLDPSIIYAANPAIEHARREEDRRRRRIDKIHQNPALYEQLRAKQRTLHAIKTQICCLIKFAKQEMGRSSVGEEYEDMRTHPIMRKYGALQAKINRNMALLNIDLENYREARGNQALQLFHSMEKQFNDLKGRTEGYSDDSIRNSLRERSNQIAIQQLKAYLFMSKMPPNINCKSGVGYWFKGLPPERVADIDPKSDCVGYVVSLGKNHNLLILRVRGSSLEDNAPIDRVVAVVWRKVREIRKVGDDTQKPPSDIGAIDLM